MSARSPIPVIGVAFICGLLTWVFFVHLWSGAPLIGIAVAPIMLGSLVWGNSFLVGLILRDTIRRRGFWGINFRRIVCTQCGTPWVKMMMMLPSWREIVRGIYTCHKCGFEMNQWGRPIRDQNLLAKWNLLRTAENANEDKHQSQHQEERIRNMKDQTQRGDAP